MVPTLYLWSIDATAGQDSAWVDLGADGLVADGHIAAQLPEPHTVDYRLEVDADGLTRGLAVRVRRAAGVREIDLSNSAGRWTVDGVPRPDLDGALDVDLAGCPLTNVMPIRRHGLVRHAGSQELLMAFVEVPELRVVPSPQRYTHVRRLDDGGAIIGYASGEFRSDLTVDAHGFVVDYPRLGRRITSGQLEGQAFAERNEPSGGTSDALSATDRAFLAERRTATLATMSEAGWPRLVPICFVVGAEEAEDGRTVIWSPLDAKPKRSADPRQLARVRDIAARPEVTLLFERWSEEWSELAWVRAAGRAALVEADDDRDAHRRAVEALRAKYPQYRMQPIETLPMIRIVLSGATRWQATPRPVPPSAPRPSAEA